MKKPALIIIFMLSLLYQCQEPPVYPDQPIIDYENYFLYISKNSLDEEVLFGQINFSFTDGDGNIGFEPFDDTLAINLPDSLRYNLFLQLYNYDHEQYVKVPEEEGGYLKYIIPYLDKQPLQGTISVTIEYPIIHFDTIFYTFFLYDRDLNRSNTDTTDVRVLFDINE